MGAIVCEVTCPAVSVSLLVSKVAGVSSHSDISHLALVSASRMSAEVILPPTSIQLFKGEGYDSVSKKSS